MLQVLDCGLSQSTCPSNSSPMTQTKTRQRRPALFSNPNRTSSESNKTFSSSPPPILLPIRDIFSHSRAFSKKTKVIFRVRTSTTWLTCLAKHRWTSKILAIYLHLTHLEINIYSKYVNYFLNPLCNLSLCHKHKTLQAKFSPTRNYRLVGCPSPFIVIHRLKHLTTQRKIGDLTKHCV